MHYTPSGVCSHGIDFELEDGIVKNVRFAGGCSGNTQGVAALVQGMPAEEAIRRLKGLRCGFKPTSCPDQLAKALEAALVSQ
ncbi:MAG: TIGR03905 family TSCPD domain-containing protein [Lachnospiraceae bacterium]|nr:TIGR03905 family TSCPD domain-containing protein [Lachnospiraceae bacterium]